MIFYGGFGLFVLLALLSPQTKGQSYDGKAFFFFFFFFFFFKFFVKFQKKKKKKSFYNINSLFSPVPFLSQQN